MPVATKCYVNLGPWRRLAKGSSAKSREVPGQSKGNLARIPRRSPKEGPNAPIQSRAQLTRLAEMHRRYSHRQSFRPLNGPYDFRAVAVSPAQSRLFLDDRG